MDIPKIIFKWSHASHWSSACGAWGPWICTLQLSALFQSHICNIKKNPHIHSWLFSSAHMWSICCCLYSWEERLSSSWQFNQWSIVKCYIYKKFLQCKNPFPTLIKLHSHGTSYYLHRNLIKKELNFQMWAWETTKAHKHDKLLHSSPTFTLLTLNPNNQMWLSTPSIFSAKPSWCTSPLAILKPWVWNALWSWLSEAIQTFRFWLFHV